MVRLRRAVNLFRPNGTNRPGKDLRPGEDARRGMPAFRYRNYRLYFSGQIISVIGTWMQATAEAWLVVSILHASPLQLSLVTIFQFTPVMILGLPSGLLADRFPKRNLLMLSQLTFGMLAAMMSLLIFTDAIQLWHVYAVALTYGLTSAIDQPARQAFVSEMVGKEAIMYAVSTNSAVFNTGRVIGPAVAGAVLVAVGPALCFAINAASYVVVLAMLARMHVKPVVARVRGSAASGLKEGLAYVRSTPNVLLPIVLIGVIGVFGMNFNVWVPLLAAEDFGASAGTYGALMSAMGIGALSGALSLAVFGRRPSRQRMLTFATLLGLAELVRGVIASIPGPVVAGMIALAAAGFCMSTTSAMANTIVQTTAPDALRGRVMSVYTTIFSGTAPVGALLTGAIADRFSAAVAVGFGGAVAAMAAIVIASVHRRRQTEREQHAA
jgi:MFS family permease